MTTNKNRVSGELFDLTITDYINQFGKEKILYSLMFGISLPLDKYIDELMMIVGSASQEVRVQGAAMVQESSCERLPALNENFKDDKYVKRRDRLIFLMECNENHHIRGYFQMMCNFINGRNGNYDEQYPQSVILTCAGGNIITIFAKLLWELFLSPRGTLSKEVQNITFNKNIYLIYKSIDPNIVLTIKNQLDEICNAYFFDILQRLQSNDYSDFDYSLVPNISNSLRPIDNNVKRDLDRFDKKFDDDQIGGMLRRSSRTQPDKKDRPLTVPELQFQEKEERDIKRRMKQKALKDAEENIVKIPNKTSKKKEVEPTPIQQHKEGFVLFRVKSLFKCDLNAINMPRELKKISDILTATYKTKQTDCLDVKQNPPPEYINLYPQMAQQSWLNLPQINANPNCRKFIERLLAKKAIIENATKINVNTAINIINPTGRQEENLNSIMLYLNTVTSNLNGYMRNVNFPLTAFQSLQNIITSGLIELSSSLLIQFLTNEIYKTKNIIDVIGRQILGVSEKAVFNLVGTSEGRDLILPKIDNLKTTVESGNQYKGVNITVNAITTETVAQQEVTEINSADIDTSTLDVDDVTAMEQNGGNGTCSIQCRTTIKEIREEGQKKRRPENPTETTVAKKTLPIKTIKTIKTIKKKKRTTTRRGGKKTTKRKLNKKRKNQIKTKKLI